MDRSLHVRMVEVVEGAYSDICSAKDDGELAEWSYAARVPIKELVRPHTANRAWHASDMGCRASCTSVLRRCLRLARRQGSRSLARGGQ